MLVNVIAVVRAASEAVIAVALAYAVCRGVVLVDHYVDEAMVDTDSAVLTEFDPTDRNDGRVLLTNEDGTVVRVGKVAGPSRNK